MSLQSWKDEFYTVDAKCVTAVEAVQHSINKWEGLCSEALARHEVVHLDGQCKIADSDYSESLSITDDSCALCHHYFGTCRDCPLYKVRGNAPCDVRRGDEDNSPFKAWRDHGDNKPMLFWLKMAKAFEEKQEVKEYGRL